MDYFDCINIYIPASLFNEIFLQCMSSSIKLHNLNIAEHKDKITDVRNISNSNLPSRRKNNGGWNKLLAMKIYLSAKFCKKKQHYIKTITLSLCVGLD